MVETDKVGTFFFFCLAMIVMLEERYLRKATDPSQKPISSISDKIS
jgi:hypothetical protein